MFVNISRHLKFGLIVLTEDSDLILEIQDDGIGFSPEDVSGPPDMDYAGCVNELNLSELIFRSSAGLGTAQLFGFAFRFNRLFKKGQPDE